VRTVEPSSSYLLRRFLAVLVLAMAVFLVWHHARAAQSEPARMGLVQDWSHRHVVFSSPSDIPTLMAIRQDPRFLHQLLRRNTLGLNPTMGLNPAAPTSTPDVAADQEQEQLGEQAENESESDSEGTGSPHQQATKVDWSMSLGANNTHVQGYPAKFSFDVTAPPSCLNDFVVFPTALAGSSVVPRQATIIAYNNLYSTQGIAGGLCAHNGPTVKWAYNTGAAIRTSPVLSFPNAAKVAWVSVNGVVHVLTIGTTGANGTSATAPATPGVGNNAVNATVTLSGAPAVTASSLFVDYTHDAAYIGDDNGRLHKIVNIFNGVPAEFMASGWPVTVNVGVHLSGPVFDFFNNNIYVTDGNGRLSYVRDVNSTSGCLSPTLPGNACLGSFLVLSTGSGIPDPPIVDSSTGHVFSETAASTNIPNAAVVQVDTALTPASMVTVPVGTPDAANPLHNGDFDNNYLNGPTLGFYYVCGKGGAGATSMFPTLYRIGFHNVSATIRGVMNAAVDPATPVLLARGRTQCSPATEFFNTSAPQRDWLFLSVRNLCSATGGIPGGCIMSYNITNGMPAAFTRRAAEKNGTSGIIVDNVAAAAQASSIYFSNQGNPPPNCGNPGGTTGGCAVKLTQSSLQ